MDPDDPRRDAIVKAAFRYREGLLCHAYAILRDWNTAEDVVQDAFLVVVRKWQDCHDITGVFPWVRQMVTFRAMDVLRSRGRTRGNLALAETIGRVMESGLDADEADAQGRLKDALATCMQDLDRRSLDLLVGFYWQRRSCDELAASQSRTVNAVRLVLSRLRTRLRDCLGQRVGDEVVATALGREP